MALTRRLCAKLVKVWYRCLYGYAFIARRVFVSLAQLIADMTRKHVAACGAGVVSAVAKMAIRRQHCATFCGVRNDAAAALARQPPRARRVHGDAPALFFCDRTSRDRSVAGDWTARHLNCCHTIAARVESVRGAAGMCCWRGTRHQTPCGLALSVLCYSVQRYSTAAPGLLSGSILLATAWRRCLHRLSFVACYLIWWLKGDRGGRGGGALLWRHLAIPGRSRGW